MTTETEATTHVVVCWGDDDEPWLYEATEGESEGAEHRFEVDIPASLWEANREALEAFNRAHAACLAAVGLDGDRCRLAVCCAAWEGGGYEARVWWNVTVAASLAGSWPVRDHVLRAEKTDVEAREWIATLPDEFYVCVLGGMWLCRRDRLRVDRSGMPAYVSTCYRCGWGRSEHANA